jgi:PAS domain S-box-containing protein
VEERFAALRQGQSTQLQALAEASIAINLATSVEKILQEIAERARALIGAHQSVTSLTTGEHYSQAIHAVSLSDKYAAWSQYAEVPDGSGIYSYVCRTNKPVRMTQAELEAHPFWKGFGKHKAAHPPMRGWLAAPLVGRDGSNLGLVQLSDKYEGEFTVEDEAILVQLAQLGSVAAENARLLTQMRRAEQAARAHSQLLRSVADNATLGLFMMNAQQQCTFMNLAAERITGFSFAEIQALNRPLHDIVHHTRPDGSHFPLSECPIDRVLPTRNQEQGETVFIHKSGAFYPVAFTASPILENGVPIGTIIEVRDVTQEKRAEQALRLSEGRFRSLVEANSQVVWLCTDDGRIESPLPTWEAFTGQSFEEYQGHGWLEAIHPEDRERTRKLWEAGRVERKRYETEYRLRRADGSYSWTAAYGAPVLDEQGHILEWVGMNIDVMERKLVQEALRESGERLVAALSASGTGTFRWDLRTNALDWDENLDRLFGLVPGQTARKLENFIAMVHPDDRPGVIAHCEACARDGADFDMDFRVIWPDGTVRWLADKGKTFRDGEGKPLYMTGACMDITEQRRVATERERLITALQRSNAELDQFAYVASHDLKAPLRGIASLSQWLEEDLGPVLTDQTREQLRLLQGRVHRMEALIDGILNYSRAGRTRHKVETVEVGKLLTEVVEMVSPRPGSRIEFPPGLPVLRTERVPLQQVFMNLINNALKHSRREDTHVRIGTRSAGAFVEFSVADNGQGIAPEYHERIWVIFQTLEARDKVEGTGIGLSVVKKIVESRGGRVWVESSEGAGASFHFTWPQHTHEVQ